MAVWKSFFSFPFQKNANHKKFNYLVQTKPSFSLSTKFFTHLFVEKNTKQCLCGLMTVVLWNRLSFCTVWLNKSCLSWKGKHPIISWQSTFPRITRKSWSKASHEFSKQPGHFQISWLHWWITIRIIHTEITTMFPAPWRLIKMTFILM